MGVPAKTAEIESSLPSQLITPVATIGQVLDVWRTYQDLKDKLGTDDDFQAIGNKKHPKKSFVRKVQRFFGLSCEILRDEPILGKDGDILGWLATARAIHVPSGLYQDADGSCSFSEKAETQRTLHNIRSHAITRAKNRAILDLAGFGDVSAEEISEAASPRHQPAKTKSQQKSQAQAHIQATDVRRLYSLAIDDLGWSREAFLGWLSERFGVSKSSEMTSQQVERAIKELEELRQEIDSTPESEDGEIYGPPI